MFNFSTDEEKNVNDVLHDTSGDAVVIVDDDKNSKKPKDYRKWLLLGILIVVAFIGWIVWAYHTTRPQYVLRQYCDAIVAGDYDQAYSYTEENDSGVTAKESFVRYMKYVFKDKFSEYGIKTVGTGEHTDFFLYNIVLSGKGLKGRELPVALVSILSPGNTDFQMPANSWSSSIVPFCVRSPHATTLSTLRESK